MVPIVAIAEDRAAGPILSKYSANDARDECRHNSCKKRATHEWLARFRLSGLGYSGTDHQETNMAKISKFPQRKPAAALDTPSDLSERAVNALTTALNGLLADFSHFI